MPPLCLVRQGTGGSLSPKPDAMTLPLDCSRFLQRLFAARPELEMLCQERIETPVTREELLALSATGVLDDDTLKRALRRFKQEAYARIATRDLAQKAPLAEVTEGMTLIAEMAIDRALDVHTRLLQARYGTPRSAEGVAQQLIVIGMGKLGGRELNASSDIDLIFVYPDDGDTDGERSISNFDYFSRLGRALINAIGDITEDGQVFRVDMRLRPNGDSGPAPRHPTSAGCLAGRPRRPPPVRPC